MLKIDIHTHILPENWPDLRDLILFSWMANTDRSLPEPLKVIVELQMPSD